MLKATSKPGTPGVTRHPALSSPKALLEYLARLSSAHVKKPLKVRAAVCAQFDSKPKALWSLRPLV